MVWEQASMFGIRITCVLKGGEGRERIWRAKTVGLQCTCMFDKLCFGTSGMWSVVKGHVNVLHVSVSHRDEKQFEQRSTCAIR